jgi:hypothetical protein
MTWSFDAAGRTLRASAALAEPWNGVVASLARRR